MNRLLTNAPSCPKYSGDVRSGIKDEIGQLGIRENYGRDFNDPAVTGEVIVSPPSWMTQGEWDQAVLRAGERALKQDAKRKYKPFPSSKKQSTEDNCHTVTSDIIESAGGSIPQFNPPGLNPGLRTRNASLRFCARCLLPRGFCSCYGLDQSRPGTSVDGRMGRRRTGSPGFRDDRADAMAFRRAKAPAFAAYPSSGRGPIHMVHRRYGGCARLAISQATRPWSDGSPQSHPVKSC